MARDRCLLTTAQGGTPSARVYSWENPAVSLGQFQRVDDALLRDARIQWVRRPTGGRAVLHGHDVTVGIALPLDGLSGVRQVYPVVIGILAAALRDSGAEAVLGAEILGERGTNPRSADCFATVSPNDIVHPQTRQKVCGCALRLTDRAVLVQASIPAGPPFINPVQVYREPAPVSWIDVNPFALAAALESRINEKPRSAVPSGVTYSQPRI